MINFLQNIMQLILAPSKGWEDMSYAHHDLEELVQRRMYPLFGLAAVTHFVQMLYHPGLTVEHCLVVAAGIFVSLFATYFFADLMYKMYVGRFTGKEADSERATVTICYTLCLLALATTICNVIPITLGFNVLLPIGVALVLWKSAVYLGVKADNDFRYACFGVTTVIVPPYLLQWLFDLIA